MDLVTGLIHSLVKTVLHFVTGKCELERLTQGYPTGRTEMVGRVRTSLKQSKKLANVRLRVVEACEDFSIKIIVREIREVKKFENAGLVFSLGALRRTNVGIQHLSILANTNFANEYEVALIELWDSLRPGQQREGSSLRHSSSWSDIGFQGFDPATDFRGAGMLALENLRYFARENSDVARRILNEQCGDIVQGGFPFAITGINITAFLLNLVVRRRMDDLFLFLSAEAEDARSSERRTTRARPSSEFGRSSESTPLLSESIQDDADDHRDDDETKALALERFNIAFSVVFTMFSNRWREAAPRDAMQFPLVFGPFKKEIEALTKTQAGIYSLARANY